MNVENTRKLDRWLSRLGPEEFDYGLAHQSNPCGCVAWHVRASTGQYYSVGGETALAEFLSLQPRDAMALFVGEITDEYGRCSTYSADGADHAKELTRARQCLREIAQKHGINLDAPAEISSADRESAFLCALKADLAAVAPTPQKEQA